jgi:hypothetical protein
MQPAMAIVRRNLNDEFTHHLDKDFHIRCIFLVINRAVMYVTQVFKKAVNVFRQLLKAVRGSLLMSLKFFGIGRCSRNI